MTAGRKVNSSSQSWCTPPKYVNAIRDFWNGEIELDPCSNEFSIVNAKVEYMLPHADGLKEEWNARTIYVNPPYGADRERRTTIKNWLAKCVQAHQTYLAEVIALIPVAPNTTHWKKYVFGKAASICFLYDTRLRFWERGQDVGKGAPMACCLVYWGNDTKRFFEHFIRFGAVVDITNLMEKQIGVDYSYGEIEFGMVSESETEGLYKKK